MPEELFIPLQFWFQKDVQLALPLYRQVKKKVTFSINESKQLLLGNHIIGIVPDEYLATDVSHYSVMLVPRELIGIQQLNLSIWADGTIQIALTRIGQLPETVKLTFDNDFNSSLVETVIDYTTP
jgi:hypothetical protein